MPNPERVLRCGSNGGEIIASGSGPQLHVVGDPEAGRGAQRLARGRAAIGRAFLTARQSPLWQKISFAAVAALMSGILFVASLIFNQLAEQNTATGAQNRELGELRTLIEGVQQAIDDRNGQNAAAIDGLDERVRDLERRQWRWSHQPEE